MKLRTLLLMISAAYWAGAVPAHAGIESLIIGIHGFLLSSTAISATVAGTLATVIGYGVAGAAIVGASLLGRQQKGGAVKPSDVKSTFETGESSIIEGVGRVRVGGLKAFGNTDGSTRARLVCRLQGPIDAIEAYYLGQREVTVEANGDVSSPPWARPGGSWANWQDKLGTGAETAWAGIMSLFPDLWTSAHRVRGIAQSQLLFYNPGLKEEKYLSLYQNGAPESEWIARASKVFDPRDLSQWPNDPLTWKWSDNSPLICAHVLRRDPAFKWTRFSWAKIADAANKADVLVPTLTGTEKRSRLWGMWAWESERGETMQQFLDSAGLEQRLDENGLIYFEFIDDDIAPEISFTPEDIYDYSWQSGPEAVERPNIARVKYYSPERNYEMTDLALEGKVVWAKVQDEVDRYGDKFFDLELPFCPSASQAQRILRRKFALARADRGTMTTNMVGLAAWGLLYAEITEPDLDDVEKVRMDAPRVDDENGAVEIPFTVWPTLAPWNPATDEAPAPDIIPELGYETDMITPNAPQGAIEVTYPGGAKELRLAYVLPAQSYDLAEATYHTYSGSVPNAWQSMTEFPAGAYVAGAFAGLTIDARVRVFNGEEGSLFSPLLNTVVAVDNVTPILAPTVVSGGGGDGTLAVVVTQPQMHVTHLTLERRVNSGPWIGISQFNVRPAQQVGFNDTVTTPDSNIQWRIQAHMSNGAGGAYLNFSGSTPAA
ncbi:hypothetical protein E2F50_13095 [Rhizobium deserti]|uniref:Tip attachment protein J domain-containing protein n=1 Tax=Rhizobium deserti TaxID=2547961 RepID=A0A4R5UH72_9HYPH|nr:phage tail protein [Rhizobium deserti]TDK35192.1 hypothetical protein E2F50_13095 [Rhizobium deserti]